LAFPSFGASPSLPPGGGPVQDGTRNINRCSFPPSSPGFRRPSLSPVSSFLVRIRAASSLLFLFFFPIPQRTSDSKCHRVPQVPPAFGSFPRVAFKSAPVTRPLLAIGSTRSLCRNHPCCASLPRMRASFVRCCSSAIVTTL